MFCGSCSSSWLDPYWPCIPCFSFVFLFLCCLYFGQYAQFCFSWEYISRSIILCFVSHYRKVFFSFFVIYLISVLRKENWFFWESLKLSWEYNRETLYWHLLIFNHVHHLYTDLSCVWSKITCVWYLFPFSLSRRNPFVNNYFRFCVLFGFGVHFLKVYCCYWDISDCGVLWPFSLACSRFWHCFL